MVQGRDRRPELGYKLAMELRKQIKQLEQENRIWIIVPCWLLIFHYAISSSSVESSSSST